MANILGCARKLSIDPQDVGEIQAHIDAVGGDPALGVQQYLETLEGDTRKLQDQLLNEGVYVDVLSLIHI